MKKYSQIFGALSIMLASQLSFAGNFDSGYNFVDLRCKSKSHNFNLMIEHEKISGIRSVTENIFEKDGVTLEDQIRRVFMVHGMQSDTRFIVSQKKDSTPLAKQDPIVVLYANTKELNSATKLKIEIGKGTLEEAIGFKITTEDADCTLKSQQQDGDSE